MVSFAVELADVCVGVEALFGSTRDFCADYLTDAVPTERVTITEADIAAEHERAARQDERDGLSPRTWSDTYLETLALYRKVAACFLPHDTVVFHGTAVAVAGRAYLFTAPSGTGKTTHARYWLSQVPGAYVLNGDKPLLRVDADDVRVFGTPWRGKERLGVRGNLPLAGLCLLERGEADAICRIDAHEALPELIRQTHCPSGADALVCVVGLVARLAQAVPLWRMQATLDEASAQVSYAGMAAGH